MKDLRPEKAFIFRIVHRDNMDWILKNGVHCRSANQINPNYVDIGNPDLIGKRSTRAVPAAPHGTLSDYVPFYFTPRSPMLYNIKTGYNVPRRPNEEIVILVSSLFKIVDQEIDFLFTDSHAYLQTAQFYDDLDRLDEVDWAILQASDFKRDNNDLGKFERYQAEALIHEHVPLAALRGVACCNEAEAQKLRGHIAAADVELKVAAKPSWYF
ncbi:type II toxin-antitoxin system toxin DNA ADP-ribosyl transferase DarT [Sphingopyxis sp.]|uniref:type II toxin-antitoxin system toxin DNA ADP-ribosyl transferase DarT n=1 Tax=Sphingopyxis sp. TaxID=1908224 RepID=UPI003BA95075